MTLDSEISVPGNNLTALIAQVRHLRDQGGDKVVGKRSVAKALNISPDQARRLLDKLKFEDARRGGAVDIDPGKTLEFHPLANVLPLIEGAEFEDLVADIRANGQRDDIVLLDGMVLDGRNRYRACVAAGVKPRVVTRSRPAIVSCFCGRRRRCCPKPLT
jgi:hypothetical protein